MKRFFLCAAAALIAASAFAKVELPNIIGDNMVLQRETSVALWGKAKAGAKLTIAPSWTKSKTTLTVGQDGKWSAKVATPAAGGPYEIVFNDGEKLTVRNVLIGEVWFCGGQSNMQMPVKGFGGQRVEGAFDAIMNASPATPIRLCTSKIRASLREEEENPLQWKENTPDAVASHSAVSYFFAVQLQKILGVPVGVISCNWGGSTIETWISREWLEKGNKEWQEKGYNDPIKLGHLEKGELPAKNQNHAGALAYNAMVAPLIPFTFKGIIWYQGESNRARPDQYVRLSKLYVEMMRSLWDNPELPFYAVQIASYKYGKGVKGNPEGVQSPLLEEAQLKAAQQIKHSGLATTLDVGDPDCIHPAKKLPVAQRLAALALENDYGFKGICSRAPEFKDMKIDSNKVTLNFHVFGSPLTPNTVELDGFEVAGEDKVFHKATSARVVRPNRAIEVVCDEVPAPVAVRYAFHNVAEASVFNGMGIPVGPFRTDNWDK
ncbi:MAG: sialate O-acetylesterase [Bacteroidales bacterium]|nr:sialate O-acetylesterase [Bacteroidales bacterium]